MLPDLVRLRAATWIECIRAPGFFSQGNEFSYHMLLASYFILNWCLTACMHACLCVCLRMSMCSCQHSATVPISVCVCVRVCQHHDAEQRQHPSVRASSHQRVGPRGSTANHYLPRRQSRAATANQSLLYGPPTPDPCRSRFCPACTRSLATFWRSTVPVAVAQFRRAWWAAASGLRCCVVLSSSIMAAARSSSCIDHACMCVCVCAESDQRHASSRAASDSSASTRPLRPSRPVGLGGDLLLPRHGE